MLRFALAISLGLLCQTASAQLSTIFVNLIGVQNRDQAVHTAYVWKQMPDLTYKVKSKAFATQTMITLDPGTYILEVSDRRARLFVDKVEFTHESCVVYNLYTKPVRLVDADFKSITYATPGMLDLISRRISYMEF